MKELFPVKIERFDSAFDHESYAVVIIKADSKEHALSIARKGESEQSEYEIGDPINMNQIEMQSVFCW